MAGSVRENLSRWIKGIHGYHTGMDHQHFKNRVKRCCENERSQTNRGRKKTQSVRAKEEILLRGRD